MKLYVGNLPYNTTEDDLRTLFSPYGAVDFRRDHHRPRHGPLEGLRVRRVRQRRRGAQRDLGALRPGVRRPRADGQRGASQDPERRRRRPSRPLLISNFEEILGGRKPPFFFWGLSLDSRAPVSDVRLERWSSADGAALREADDAAARARGLRRPGLHVPPRHGLRRARARRAPKCDGVLEGVLRITVGGEAFDLGPGDRLYVPAGTRHAAEVVGNADGRLAGWNALVKRRTTWP